MLRRAALAIVAVVVLVAVPGPGMLPARAAVHDSPSGPTLATDAIPLPPGSIAAPLASSTSLRLAFTLAFSNASRLTRFLAEVSDPSSPEYDRFLSYSTFYREFGPAPSALVTVEDALQAAGGRSVGIAPGGLAVVATLSPPAVEQLLGVDLLRFAIPGAGDGFTAVGTPRLSAPMNGLVAGIDGLSSRPSRSPLAATVNELSAPRVLPSEFGSYVWDDATDSNLYLGSDYSQAYGATDLLPGSHSVSDATYPSGIAIATLLASGYNASLSTPLPPWAPFVIDQYFNDTFPAGWPLPKLTGVPVNESGAPSPPSPGPFNGLNDSTGYEVENSLDLEMAGSLAPGASLYNFYISGELLNNPVTAGNESSYLADALGKALSYPYTTTHLAVVSCSFGLADTNNSQWDAELATAAAMGVTVVASSGDQGDAPDALTGRGGQWPLWPATAAFNTSGAISVGGVSVVLSGTPTATYTPPHLSVKFDPNVTGIANTTTWWDTSGGIGSYAGSEGGASLVYHEPWWQFDSAAQPAIVNATVTEGSGMLGRAGPDVAFPANSTIAYVSPESGALPDFAVFGGTSVAAPVFAGLLADVVAVAEARNSSLTGLGFLDPELYRIASYYRANPGASDPFLDVLSGSNFLFSAGPGWDASTGWGGLSAPLLLAALSDPSVDEYNYTGPTPGLPVGKGPPTTWLTVVVLAAGAAAVLGGVYVLYVSRTRSRRGGPATLSPYPAGSTAPAWSEPVTRPVATFSCPYCGRERPAEAGRCPGCGAM